MTRFQQLEKDMVIVIKALTKMRRRQNLLEARLEKIDGIKQKRPEDVSMLYARVDLWEHNK